MRIYVLALSVWLSLASHARAQTLSPTLTTIYNFTGTNACLGAAHCDGTGPEGLAIGSSGVLYGTTAGGGTYGAGTAFSLTPPTDPGGAWTETVLYSFAGGENGGHDGIEPGGVVIGGGGVLYGTTFYGGDDSACFRGYGGPPGCGTLFSVTPPTTPGGAWAEAVLFSFYGVTPDPSLVTSGAGVLYGETVAGPCFPLFGSTCATYAGSGYVYSLAPPAAPGGGWIQTSFYTFTAGLGYSNVVIGSGGLPYLATYSTTNPPTGQVLSLSPPAGGGNQPWTATVLYTFTDAEPYSLAVGKGGVLYGASASGVWSSGAQTYGSLWSLTPPAAAGGPWVENTLYSFTEPSVWTPIVGLSVAGDGALYGTAYTGSSGCGTLFSLTPPSTPGGAWAETTLHNFTCGIDGGGPDALVMGSDGVLYGTVTAGGAGGNGYVFSLKLTVPQPSINPGGLVTAASYTSPVAPGSIASVFGDFFVSTPVSATGLPLPSSLSGLSLQFDSGAPAPLFFVSGGQANLQVPWELAGQPQANLAASLSGQNGAAQTVNLATFAPAIFSTNSTGSGQGAILNGSYHLVDVSNPATPGSTVLQIFCTGLGPVSNQPQTGSPAPLSPLAYTTTTPTVTVGGVPTDVSFSGLAPGYVGLYQVNAQVPVGLAANNAVPVVISMEGTASNTVTIAVE
jgi:uncharacterized protein (TIGR03437 family)